MEDTGQLMPTYLRFVRGVIDSGDLPLNVSREMLQGSRAVDHIRSAAVKRVLKLLKDMADNEPDKYATFWKEFGATLKEGIPEDYGNRDEIAKLLRFNSTRSASQEQQDVSLADYVARMKDGQEKVYSLLAPTLAAAGASPHLEAFKEKGIEVLLLGQAVDNWVVTSLQDFDGRRLQSVTQGVPDFGALSGSAEQEASQKAAAECADLVAKMKTVLAGQAFDVRVTNRQNLAFDGHLPANDGPDAARGTQLIGLLTVFLPDLDAKARRGAAATSRGRSSRVLAAGGGRCRWCASPVRESVQKRGSPRSRSFR